MDIICERYLCTGCGACFNKCPQSAIYMQEDEEGFLYPIIDSEKCTDCGLCKKTCPVCNATFENDKTPNYTALNAKDNIRLNKTSSGGAFTLIAEYIIRNGGYVCGAYVNEDLFVKHIIINEIEDIVKLRGSKYVQSEMGTCYKDIKTLLKQNKKVFFVGTPCQVSGLKLFLQNEYNNLITADLVCHGVPPQKLLNKYLKELNLDNNEKILDINFRDKKYGWGDFSFSIKTNKRTLINIKTEDAYLLAFLENLSLRKSCGNCKFACIPRQGDFSLADFWNIKKIDKSFYDKKGTSLILLNNEKAKELYKNVKIKTKKYREFPFDENLNNLVCNPSILSDKRLLFFDLIKNNTLADTIKICNNEKFDYLLLNFWYSNDNYGAVLTAYALQELIKQQGFTCRLLNSKHIEYTENLFSNFVNKYLDISNSYDFNTLKKFSKNLKGIFLGSDQVLRFEYLIGEENLNTFLLNFSNDKNVKKIAFSPSFGLDKDRFLNNKFNNKYKFSLMKKALNSFDYLSCREISGKEIYNDLFGLKSDFIIDPVFLLDKFYYENIINESKIDFSNKIVTYILDDNEKENEIVQKIKEKYKIEVINISADKKYSISDWLNAIKNCKYFVTDSFHGTCFALIFNKNFICVKNKGRGGTRFDTLHSLFNIQTFMIENITDLNLENKINYDLINAKIDKEQERCLNILHAILFNDYSNNKQSDENKLINKEYLNKRNKSLFYKYRYLSIKNIPIFMNFIKCYIILMFSKGIKKEHYKYKKNMLKLSLYDFR